MNLYLTRTVKPGRDLFLQIRIFCICIIYVIYFQSVKTLLKLFLLLLFIIYYYVLSVYLYIQRVYMRLSRKIPLRCHCRVNCISVECGEGNAATRMANLTPVVGISVH